VIRFSAALVAVAIAVLIGGIAASELSLVYIAIVVSAVALVALATGVVLKREELFGEAQGLAPAGAGASPVQSVRAGESYDQHRPATPVSPPPLQGVVVGPGAAFGRNAQAASAQSAAPWETQTARSSRPPVTVDARPAWTAPAAQTERSGSGADSRAASVRQATAPSSGTQGGWGVPDASESPAATAAATAGAAAPWSWAAPSPSAFSPTTPEAPPATTGPGSGAMPPSWFDRRNEAARADVAATAPAPASGNSWSWSSTDMAAPEGTDKADDAVPDGTRADDTVALNVTAAPADATTAVDEDDDWPTRYSWLDDEPDENGAGSDDKPDENIETADSADHSSRSPASAATLADEPATLAHEPVAAGTPDTETLAVETLDTGIAEATGIGSGDADQSEDADDAAPAPPGDPAGLGLVADPESETEAAAEAEAESGESEPPAGTTADPAPGAGLVSVIRGVPRYHDAECVLIRFMPEGDIQKLSIPQAKELGCTPCAACQPEG
jgi:hypothetical protein